MSHILYADSLLTFILCKYVFLANRFHSTVTTINKTPYSKNRTFHRLKPVNPSLRVDNSLVIWIPALTFQKALHTLNAGFTASPLGQNPLLSDPGFVTCFILTLGLKDTMIFLLFNIKYVSKQWQQIKKAYSIHLTFQIAKISWIMKNCCLYTE